MSSDCATSSYNASQRQQFRLRRKVPDGSEDFQRVLDTILSDEIDDPDNNKENIDENEDRVGYEDDFEHSEVEECHVLDDGFHRDKSKVHGSKDDIHIHCKRNNYVHGINKVLSTDSGHGSEIYRPKERHSIGHSPSPHSSIASPSLIHIFDCNGDLVYNSEGESDDKLSDRDALFGVKLPSIKQKDHHGSGTPEDLTMGANCSSGIYDQRDWHDIMGKDGVTSTKPRKRGKPFSKKQQLKLNSNRDGCGVMTSQLCTCKYRISDSSPDSVTEPLPIEVNGIKDKSPTDSDKGSIGSRLSDKTAPIGRSVSPNTGNRISRILGLKKNASPSTSSPKADVSPHRLLVRRSYSPKSRASSMEEMIRQNNDSIYRQRSHSWSNGKLGAKPTNIKSTSTSSALIQSPILSPVANHTALAPTRLISKDSSKPEKMKEKVLPEITTGQMVSNSAHEETCPLYKVSLDKGRLSPRDPEDDVDDTITPISRRRAVSESQTLRSRQKARRAAANAALQNEEEADDHLHVHWADEEGTSLSTSVFLSSIRPRSYSHGAECNVPQRPILKKVLIS